MHSSTQSRRVADQLDRERVKLENIGLRGVRPIGRQVMTAALRAYRSGGDVAQAMRDSLRRITPEIADGMLVAHLRAIDRTRRIQAAAMGDRKRLAALSLSAYDDALSFLTERLTLSPDDLRRLSARYGREAATVTGEIGTVLEDKVGRAVREAIGQGLPTRAGTEVVRRAFGAAGITPASPHLFETVYRTQLQTAYSAGRWATANDPDVAEIVWGFEYVTVGDDRVRPTHQALDGMRLAKDDPRWRELWPPNGYNCRCATIEVFADESIASPVEAPEVVEIDGVRVVPGADRGWGFNAGLVFGDLLRAA